MNGPRVCHTEWGKSEREKQISYINGCMWNLEKWYRRTYLQGRNRDTDEENGRVDTGEGEEVGWTGRLGLTHIHYHVQSRQLVGSCCIAQRAQLQALWWPNRWEGWQGKVRVGRRSKREEIYENIWLIHFFVQQKLTGHCKVIILQLEKKHTGFHIYIKWSNQPSSLTLGRFTVCF